MDEQTRSLLGTVAVLRAALIAWAVVVVAIDITGTTPIRGGIAIAALGVLAIWSTLCAALVYSDSPAVRSGSFAGAEALLAAATLALDPVIYPGAHPQTFGSAWPLSGAVVVGLLLGAGSGAVVGALIGSAGAVSVALVGDSGLDGRLMGSLGTIVLLSIAGALAGLVSDRLRTAELSRARAQMREDLARTLHDGVLQTLAVIQRRSDDTELVELAKDQEAQLRSFISTPETSRRDRCDGPVLLSAALRGVINVEQRRHGIRCELVVVDEPAELSPSLTDALTGAVGEALTNAAKHSGATTHRVFVDCENDVLVCEVSDDGCGFDPSVARQGMGLSRSIRGRIEEVGGELGIDSMPGRGTTIVMQIPLSATSKPPAY